MSQILRKSSLSKIKSSFKLKREGDGEIRKMEKEMDIYVESLVKSCYTNDDQSESSYLYDSQIISDIVTDNKERPNQVTSKENNKSKISELLNENFISEYKQVRTNLYYKLISRLQIINQNKNSSNVGLNYGYFNQKSQNKAFYEKNNKNISFSEKNSPFHKFYNAQTIISDEENDIKNFNTFNNPKIINSGSILYHNANPMMNLINLN